MAEKLTVTIVDDNCIDFLLSEDERTRRFDITKQFSFHERPVQGEFGISFLVEVERSDRQYRLLFDAGLTPAVLEHNFRALNIDARLLDHVVISHGHPDHYGGLEAVFSLANRPLPVVTHKDAFEPRYAVMPDGAVAPFYNAMFNRTYLEGKGARFVLSTSPLEVIPGVYTSGEIERKTEFEGPKPPASFAGLYQLRDGVCCLDEVSDEVALVINVKDVGLVVLTGCGHAGVINSLHQAMAVTDVDRIAAVMGGFHLGFPGTPERNIDLSIEALKEIQVQCVVPMHCTGLRAVATMLQRIPDALIQPSVGTSFTFGEGR